MLLYTRFQVDTGSIIYRDRAYNTYAIKDEIEQSNIHINPVRKKNKKKIRFIHRGWNQAHPKTHRIGVQRHQAKILAHIHAVTANGFELEIFLFVLAYGIEKAMYRSQLGFQRIYSQPAKIFLRDKSSRSNERDQEFLLKLFFLTDIVQLFQHFMVSVFKFQREASFLLTRHIMIIS